MVLELVAGSGLGSLLGARHVLEPDHLAAVSTLVTGERSARAAWLGACWGLGHTFTLFAAGAVLVLVSTEMPPSASYSFDIGVAVVMIAFGLRATHQGVVGRRFPAMPRGEAIDDRSAMWLLARPPLVVGAIHGLAGSGALTALVIASFPSTAARLAYLAAFGLGSILGMAALSGLLVWPMTRARDCGAITRRVSVAVGSLSILLGIVKAHAVIRQWL